MARSIIHSEKHIVQQTLATAMAAQVVNTNIVSVVQDGDTSLAQNVTVGTDVSAVFVEMWVLGSSQQPTTITAMIYKTPSDAPVITNTEMATIHTYPNKKNIFYQTQGLVGDANSNPIPIIRQWIKIPKGKSRFGLGDKLRFSLRGITEDTQYCGQFIYKAKF